MSKHDEAGDAASDRSYVRNAIRRVHSEIDEARELGRRGVPALAAWHALRAVEFAIATEALDVHPRTFEGEEGGELVALEVDTRVEAFRCAREFSVQAGPVGRERIDHLFGPGAYDTLSEHAGNVAP